MLRMFQVYGVQIRLRKVVRRERERERVGWISVCGIGVSNIAMMMISGVDMGSKQMFVYG